VLGPYETLPYYIHIYIHRVSEVNADTIEIHLVEPLEA
jgi:hypothetical protein